MVAYCEFSSLYSGSVLEIIRIALSIGVTLYIAYINGLNSDYSLYRYPFALYLLFASHYANQLVIHRTLNSHPQTLNTHSKL